MPEHALLAKNLSRMIGAQGDLNSQTSDLESDALLLRHWLVTAWVYDFGDSGLSILVWRCGGQGRARNCPGTGKGTKQREPSSLGALGKMPHDQLWGGPE